MIDTITLVSIIWILLSMFYIDDGLKFIGKIKNPFKICLFTVLLGPGFWGIMILLGVVYFMILVFDYISKFTSPTYDSIRNWWLK